MKKDIHPNINDVVFLDTSSGAQFITTSILKSDEKTTINGKEYFVIKVEISSESHPFYTGKQKLMDSTGRVDKFMAKMQKAQDSASKKAKTTKKGQAAEDAAAESAEDTDNAEVAETSEE